MGLDLDRNHMKYWVRSSRTRRPSQPKDFLTTHTQVGLGHGRHRVGQTGVQTMGGETEEARQDA
jgi:hypothetical protein